MPKAQTAMVNSLADYKICATMGLLDILNHLLNFAAPAAAVAIMLPLIARLAGAGKGASPAFVVQATVNFAACLSVLLAGLWLWGRDGKMATYAAMVLVCATTQWAMQRAWRP